MRFRYYEEIDSLYIDLSETVGTDSREVSEDFIVDYDSEGRMVGFDIQHASEYLDLSRIEAVHLSLPVALQSDEEEVPRCFHA